MSTDSDQVLKKHVGQLSQFSHILYLFVLAQGVVWVLHTVLDVFNPNECLWVAHLAHGCIAISSLYLIYLIYNKVRDIHTIARGSSSSIDSDDIIDESPDSSNE